jgi:hypothetical protein
MAKRIIICKSCASPNLKELGSEICVHSPGLEGLNKAPFLIFPRLVVCLECGFTEFVFPETQLRSVGECTAGDVRVL